MMTLAGRLRTAVHLLTGPWEWWLALKTIAWLAVLPLLKRRLPLPRLARLMWSRGSLGERRLDREQRAIAIVRGLSRASGENCLERSLVLYRFLSRANADPALVAGMSGSAGALGHAWVEVEGKPLLETEQTLAHYVEVFRFEQEGRLAPPPSI